jgi:phosphoribosylformimino-5-aminoimidazole carboxamide ribotide isomerase
MKVIPVLDLQRGCVVRGIGGRRSEYRPLTPDCHPSTVAHSFRERFGLTELYLADLDAIAGAPPAVSVYAELHRHGFALWVDAGIRTGADADLLLSSGIESVVVGLETLTGPEVLRDLCEDDSLHIVFSLDLREGVPLGDVSKWTGAEAKLIAQQAIDLGAQRLLLLDLARVGTKAGIGTEPLARQLITAHPGIAISVGGGVRGADDLRRLKRMGLHAVLVASALHDARIRPEHLAGL